MPDLNPHPLGVCKMGNAPKQGSLWGARAEDYSTTIERAFLPLYQVVFERVGLAKGMHMLDVGCGPGLAVQLAMRRGATAAGLDAADSSLQIARRRTPDADFRSGDMESLPWPNDSFDLVTGFNAFQFAADRTKALQEARRVSRPAGRVAMSLWGPDDQCESTVIIGALRALLSSPPPTPSGPPLATPGRAEELLVDAGLRPVETGEIDCPFDFPDLETAIRAYMSAGVVVAIAEQVGAELVLRTLTEVLAKFRSRAGGYIQRNRFRFVIAGT